MKIYKSVSYKLKRLHLTELILKSLGLLLIRISKLNLKNNLNKLMTLQIYLQKLLSLLQLKLKSTKKLKDNLNYQIRKLYLVIESILLIQT